MKKKKIESLSVVEIPYGDLGWGTDPKNNSTEIFSDIQFWEGPRELDDYETCGVYYKANVPFSKKRIEYTPVEGLEVYEAMSKNISDAISEVIDDGSALLVTGGYCKDAVSVAAALQKHYGEDKKIGIVWMDAHSDMNLPETTSTGILGGMPLSTILGLGLDNWREAAGLKKTYNSKYVLLGDYRFTDKGASGNLATTDVNWLKSDEFKNVDKWRNAVNELADKVDIIYLHVDIDILDGYYVPDHVTIADNGPDMEVVKQNVKSVMDTDKVAAFFVADVYFDTDDPGKEMSTLSGMRVIGTGLENWKYQPT